MSLFADLSTRVPTARQLAALEADEKITALNDIARTVRQLIVHTIDTAGGGHIGGDLSVTDILVAAAFGFLNLSAETADAPHRDRLILSKGHCAAALYSVLALKGFFPVQTLATFMQPLALLNGHPGRKIPGVEANTGPLGHGLPVAMGVALAAKRSAGGWKTLVVLGDGEIQEGSNWETAMNAAFHRLDNLIAVIDRNRLQQGAGTEDTTALEPLAEKWASFGWEVVTVDGHDMAALLAAFQRPASGKPRAIIANTVKGKGVSFIENRVEWHHKVPDQDQVLAALQELAA